MVDRQPAKPMTWGERLTRENRALKEKIGIQRAEATILQKDLENTWQLLNAMPGGVILSEKKQIVFANEAACKALGYEKQELLERRLTDLVDPDSDIFLESLSGKISEHDKMQPPCEAAFLKKHGGKLFCAVAIRIIRRKKKKTFLINMLEIERIKEKEKRACLFLNRQAIQRIIVMFDKELAPIRLLFEKPAGGSDRSQTADKNQKKLPKTIAHLHEICSSMGSAFRLIARPEYEPAEMGLIDLKEVIRTAEMASRSRVSGVSVGEERGAVKKYLRTVSPLWGIEGEMREAFVSIIQNAMEAAGPSGEIYVTSEEDSGFAFVYVQDNGNGIGKDQVDNLYEPFFTTKKMPHRGLGLSVANAVVGRHGGKINLISREGQGTTVAVRLPLAEKGMLNRGRVRKNWIRDRSALLVTSENGLAELLRLLFVDRGGRIAIASGEKEAVRELRKAIYDLLIMSYDGSQAETLTSIERIRKVRPDLAIVLVDAGKQIQGRQFWEDQGVDFITGRPLNMDAFFHLLSEIFERKEPR